MRALVMAQECHLEAQCHHTGRLRRLPGVGSRRAGLSTRETLQKFLGIGDPTKRYNVSFVRRNAKCGLFEILTFGLA